MSPTCYHCIRERERGLSFNTGIVLLWFPERSQINFHNHLDRKNGQYWQTQSWCPMGGFNLSMALATITPQKWRCLPQMAWIRRTSTFGYCNDSGFKFQPILFLSLLLLVYNTSNWETFGFNFKMIIFPFFQRNPAPNKKQSFKKCKKCNDQLSE